MKLCVVSIVHSSQTNGCVVTGDGFHCEAEGCDVVNDCDTNASCIPDPYNTARYVCQCKPGFQGDGKICVQQGYYFSFCLHINSISWIKQLIEDSQVAI